MALRKRLALIRTLERRFGLSLQKAMHESLHRQAEVLINEGHAKNLAEIVAKLVSGKDTDVVVRRMREAGSVGETYFFRGARQLEAALDKANELIIAPRASRGVNLLRVWSAACASGEEPYTLACMLRRKFPALQVRIVATDMNPTTLAVASAAVYGPLSFREGLDPTKCTDLVTQVGHERYQVLPTLRSMVTFSTLNLVTDSFPDGTKGLTSFDLIICRNVLIYVEPAKLQSVVRKLMACAARTSLLVFTPSEYQAAQFADDYDDLGQAILARTEASVAARQPSPSQPPPKEPLTPPVPAPSSPLRPPAKPPPKAVLPSTAPRGQVVEVLESARAAADRGRIDDAQKLIDAALVLEPDSARAYCLRGLVFNSVGDPSAARDAFQRALFLEPALIAGQLGMAQALQKLGRHADARRHFQRVMTLSEGGRSERIELLDIPVDVARRVAGQALEAEERT